MAELKIDQIKAKYTLLEKYYPIIEENLPKNERKLFKYIAMYRDRYMEILSSPYPIQYPVFSPEDNDILITCCGVNKAQAIKDFLAADIPMNINHPPEKYSTFPMLSMMIMKYYLEKGAKDKFSMFCAYFSYSIYWVIFTKQFPTFLPREETMMYTINNISNKFKLKQLQSIDELLTVSVTSTITTNTARILRCSDAEIFYVANLVRNSINNFVVSISTEYMKNYKDKKVIMQGTTLTDEGALRDTLSTSNEIEALAQEYTTKFFSSPPRQDIINDVSKMRGISANELRGTLTKIIDSQAIDEVRRFYAALFYLYFGNIDSGETKKTIKSVNFIAEMDIIYKKGNSSNRNIIYIKEFMNKWLSEGSATFRSSGRPATMNDFRKAIYFYFIFLASSNK